MSLMPFAAATSPDAAAIVAVITQSYFEGAFNALDTVAMARGFHPEFAILGADGEQLERYTISQWIAAIDGRKAQPGFDIATARRDCRIVQLDVTDAVAMAKVEIDKDGKLLYTDYLSLVKFSSGWRIASKIYCEHAQ